MALVNTKCYRALKCISNKDALNKMGKIRIIIENNN